MKTIIRIAVAVVPLLAVSYACAALEFAGVMKSRDGLRFVLIETQTGKFSPWIAMGDSFASHRVVAFDEQNDVLVVKSQSRELRLPLKIARTHGGGSNDQSPKEKPTSQNTFMLEIQPDAKAVDFERIKNHLAELRPALRDIYLILAVPDNAPGEPKECMEFCEPAVRSFAAACQELGLRYVGVRALLLRKAGNR